MSAFFLFMYNRGLTHSDEIQGEIDVLTEMYS